MLARVLRLDSFGMAPRFLKGLALASLLVIPMLVGGAALAQQSGETGPAPDWVKPPSDLPRAERGDHSFSLDTLFDALKIAPDAESAKAIEERIWAIWMVSGSDTCNLLMGRSKAATDEKDYDLAVQLLDAVVALKPDYTEAWNRRATVYYLKKDYGHALADIGQVLLREPRHFGALSGLGLIMQELGDDKHALEAYRRALAIDPHLENLSEAIKTLSEQVEGRDI